MKTLVINAGSSSLKYQLVDLNSNKVLARGLCERVGSPDAFRKHRVDDNEVLIEEPLKDHTEALKLVIDSLLSGDDPVIASLDEISSVGHRVVHGGEYFDRSAFIDDDVIAKIEELAELAPLHNKAAVAGIRACQELMPDTPQVAVFDTAFFQTMPAKAYMYPIPYEYYEKYGIRKYGFHGTSHRYLSERAAAILGEDLSDLRIITCHLGNGCSITAVDHGIPVDTSMGFTPLDGLMMGTRSGSIDPAIVTFLMEHEGLSTEEVNDVLNKKSGLLGVSGISNDLRMVRDLSLIHIEMCIRDRLFEGAPELEMVVVEAAKELEAEGVRAIVGACGYFAHFQKQVADAVSVPVFLSSLCQLPLIKLGLKQDQKIAVFAASADNIDDEILSGVGSQLDDLIIQDVGSMESFAPIRWGEEPLDNKWLTEDLEKTAHDLV